jgi:hypothetical protein
MYPLILSFETINKLKLFFECGIPRPQDVGHLPRKQLLKAKVNHYKMLLDDGCHVKQSI